MSRYTATVVDTTGIQDYLFSSNRLRENIGASYLVAQATNEWAKKALEKLGKELNQKVCIPDPKELSAKPHIEDGQLAAELVYAGGGNTVLLFANPKYAEQFAQILSKRVLLTAPGLNIVVAHKEFDWEKQGSLKETIDELLENELAAKKRERVPSSPLLGLSVTADCTSTRLVAVDTSDKYIDAPEGESYLVSREIQEKLKSVRWANQKLQEKFGGTFNQEIYQFPYRIDHLGRSEGESSYVAVVHADGNSMGDRFQKHGEKRSNRDYITAMRELSQSVDDAGIAALKAVVSAIANSIEDGQAEGKLGKFALKKDEKGKYYLPFRPLVYGGDDVTFVCDGRLGLELAAIYLQAFEKQPVVDNKPLTACAGICVVKTHYPFARAYQLSEALCGNAKSLVRKQKEQWGEQNFSALDWHIAASGLLGSLGEIRQREYQVEAGSLTMRPVRLQERTGVWLTWSNFINVVQHLSGYFDAVEGNEPWKERRNKVIALREALRQGQKKTQEFMTAYGIEKLPPFKQAPDLQKCGWLNGTCGYFDAIEAMEFYLSLKGKFGEQLSTKN
jgi:hypothetical protein